MQSLEQFIDSNYSYFLKELIVVETNLSHRNKFLNIPVTLNFDFLNRKSVGFLV